MSTQWKAKDVCTATGGACGGKWVASSVVIDSRKVVKGALFVALPGEKVDGHDYVKCAIEAGAVAAIVTRYVDGVDTMQQVLVPNAEVALQQLGHAARKRSHAKFIGVTGSVGKTGTKEMLAKALAVGGNTYATTGNYNNHLGVPITLANMPLDTQFAVLEMGMNHAGEISMLSDMVKPDLAIITTVDAVHIEYFGGIEGIADAKGEIFDGMARKGVAVLNRDNSQYERLRAKAEKKGLDRVLTFGVHDDAWARLTRYAIEDTGSLVEANLGGTHVAFRIGAIGKHWALTALAVLASVEALGGNIAKAAVALESFCEPKGRGQIRKLAFKTGQLRLIDDTYNASPVSVAGAIEKVAAIRDASPEPVRTVVILGDMLELGEHAHDMHVGLVPSLINNQMDLVFAAGSFMQHLYMALPEAMRGAYAANSRELAPQVVEQLKPHDLVLVKGSRGSKMEVVVEAIEAQSSGE